MHSPGEPQSMPSPPEPLDLLVRAGFLYPADGEHDVILDGEVAVRDGLIVHVGPRPAIDTGRRASASTDRRMHCCQGS